MTGNVFGNLETEGLEKTKDVLGGFRVLETDVYEMDIKLAYIGQSASSKARSVTVHLADSSGVEYRETIWVTNKEDKNYKLDDKGKKIPQVGYVTIDELCLLSTGKGLVDQEIEEKIVPLYDFDAQKEVPKAVMVITSILGKKVKVGIEKVKEFKQVKDSNGNYVDSKDTKESNQIQKIFHAETGKTVNEFREEKEPVFMEAWTKKNQGQVRDKTKGKAGGNTGNRPEANAGRQAGSGTSLFGK